jgi:hypothetical protein
MKEIPKLVVTGREIIGRLVGRGVGRGGAGEATTVKPVCVAIGAGPRGVGGYG